MFYGFCKKLPFLTLLALLIAGAGVHKSWAANTCADLKPFNTNIDVRLTLVEDPYYDLKMDYTKIQRDTLASKKRWLEEQGLKDLWSADDLTTEGYAAAGMAASFKIDMDYRNVDTYGAYYCLYFKTIEIELFYRTMIVIPKNYAQGSCTFEVIREHELKHHDANKHAVKLYIDQLRKDLKPMVQEMEQGYVNRQESQQRIKDMVEGFKDAVDIYLFEYMGGEMNRLNSGIDSPEEYSLRSGMVDRCKMGGNSFVRSPEKETPGTARSGTSTPAISSPPG